jgi:phosphate transport system ATP-binding protein
MIALDAPLRVKSLAAYYGTRQAIADVSMDFATSSITALMGPSGCGKTTLLRCLNRIHEILPGARVEGEVLLDGEDVYESGMSVIELRRRVGMVFQRPNPFPTLSIIGNVLSGIPSGTSRRERLATAEQALHSAALAVSPEVLLMDEPTASLDPISTLSVEELMKSLAEHYTLVVVTHNMQQAARVSDYAAFMLSGEDSIGRLVEMGETSRIFTNPSDRRTEDYITGRFG